MKNGSVWYAFIGIIVGLTLGFVIANGFSRAELENRRLSAQAGQAPPVSPQAQASPEQNGSERLSVEELRQAVSRADANPNDVKLQRDLGIALYRYAGLEQNASLLVDSIRLLERAEAKAKADDTELLATLGNAQFILARQSEPARIIKARTAYQKALKANPKNADLIVDLGLTYFFAEPSEPQQALKAYLQALEANPSHERALESVVNAYLKVGNSREAAVYLDKLKAVNPNNFALSDLQVQLAQSEIAN